MVTMYNYSPNMINQNYDADLPKKSASEVKSTSKNTSLPDYHMSQQLEKLSEKIQSAFMYTKDASKAVAELWIAKHEYVI